MPDADQSLAGRDLIDIDDIIADLAKRQQQLTGLIEAALAESGEIREAARLFTLHGQNASRLGRLLRDRQVLKGDSVDGLLAAINQALDELSQELGLEL